MQFRHFVSAALMLALFSFSTKAQTTNVFPKTGSAGIGTTKPNASSLLDMESTTKGLLIPRVTLANRNAIAKPATGLLVYQTDTAAGFYYYNGTAWAIASTQWITTGNNVTYSTGDAIIHNVTVGTGAGAGYVPSNTAVGNSALFNNTFGRFNTAIGDSSLKANSSGYDNTSTGYQSLLSNTTGVNNTANGYQALYSNTNGGFNTANGSLSLYSNFNGYYNTAFGSSSLYSNNSGVSNVANGYAALYSNFSGSDNTANGFYSLFSNTTGSNNTGDGFQALRSNTTGVNNTANGFNALYTNTTGYSNVAIGTSAFYHGTTSFNTVAIGDSALFSQTAGTTTQGLGPIFINNTAIGSKALFTNSTGFNNTAIGFKSLYLNSSGTDNTAVGYQALTKNVSGGNTAIGSLALLANTSGNSNTAVGGSALTANVSGSNNTATGSGALLSLTGSYSTGYGANTLLNTTASYNTAVGYNAGATYANSANNTFLGANADVSATNFTNVTVLGYLATGTASNQVMLGNTSVNSVKAAGSFVIYSDGRFKKDITENVPGLAFINALRPVTYHYDIHGMNDKMGVTTAQNKNVKDASATDKAQSQANEDAINTKEKKLYTGFVAQEVEATASKLNYDFSGVYKPQNDKDLYGLSYADFVVPLVKAVQELSVKNDAKDSVIASLQSQVAQLTQLVQASLAARGEISSLPSQTVTLSSASLEQNTPNPYNQSTAIHYNLPATFMSAQIMVTDNSGMLLKQIPVTNKGVGIVNINAGTLSAGTYNYSLVVDGAVIDTKKMVLVKQ